MSNAAPRRKDSFFGLHFDLHPGKNDTELGTDVTEEMVRYLLEEVRPDYVQYDCKGHPGYTGYPTKVGWPSPGIVKDSLAIWRKATREFGVALFVHYSGVWDSVAVEKHPEWARVDPDGKPDENSTSTFGPYVDELLIPQLKEVADLYDLDGVWVDGDCWAVKPDYRLEAVESFRKESGIESPPRTREDPGWKEFLEFNRRRFRHYARRYVNFLHEHRPGFQITSNWMFTTLAPEPITIPLDFLSGDYSPTDSVNTARLDARYLASTGMPWDLMAWGHNQGRDCVSSPKSAAQLKQEAAVVLSQGGGFQIYYNPTRRGWIDGWMVRIMADVARFCRARRQFSFGTKTVPQVAVLLSETSIYEKADRVFGPWGDLLAPCHGMLEALLELHFSVDVLAEHQLADRLPQYPFLVIPEAEKLEPEFVDAVVKRVKDGASLLSVGAKTSRIFEEWLGVSMEGESAEQTMYLEGGDALAWVGGPWQLVQPTGAEVIGKGYRSTDTRGEPFCAASVTSLDKGKVAAIYGPFASIYSRAHSAIARRFLRDMLQRVFRNPLVEVAAPPCVDVSLRMKGDDLLVHLVNTANMQVAPNHVNIDYVPPSPWVALELPMKREPEEVSLEPGHMPVKTDTTGGELKILVESLPIHEVVTVRGFFG